MKRLPLLLIGILVLVTVLGGCAPRYARVQVRLFDALPANVEAINVTVERVELIPASAEGDEGGAILITDQPQEMNLLDLTNSPLMLGNVSVPPGNYDQVRLVVSASTVKFKDQEQPYELKIPSAYTSGFKVLLRNATFEAGVVYGVQLDFDARQSFTGNMEDGKYILKPTVRAVIDSYSGRIIGKVVDGSDPNAEPIPIVGATVQVSQNGSLVVETATDETGMFYANALLAGDYDVTVTAEGYPTFTTTATVVAKQDTDLSTIVLTK